MTVHDGSDQSVETISVEEFRREVVGFLDANFELREPAWAPVCRAYTCRSGTADAA